MTVFTAFYDLEYGPISFDFMAWLVRSKMEANLRGHEHLHVVVVPKEDGLGGFSRHWGGHDEAAARWRLSHIVVAAGPLMGCSVAVAPTREYAEDIRDSYLGDHFYWWPSGKAHFIGPVVTAARKGRKISMFAATEGAKRYVRAHLGSGDRVITLTLRNHTGDPDRNTDPKAWDQFARWLYDAGRRVVILDDANDALRAGRGYYEADVDLRLALYESAVMNVVGNNGPAELLKYSAAPYLAFDLGQSDGWRAHFEKYCGLKVGDQLPWATSRQRLVYRRSTLDNLKEEFTRWDSATS